MPKPQGRKSGWDAQDKNRGHRTHKLPKEGHGEHVGVGRARLDPGPDAVEGGPHDQDVSEAPSVEKPHDGQDERDVGEEVDHGEPVDGDRVDAVEAHEDVADDAVLQPHEGVAHGEGAEDEQHRPASLVQPGLGTELRAVHD